MIFLEETGLNPKMTRLYGRSARGKRCMGRVPHGHWQTATFIAALRHDRLSAPWLMDGLLFRTYIEQVLAPELLPGDVVSCDNLSSHKVSGVAQALEKCGDRLLYLPTSSPDLNPIAMAFSKLKAELRSAAQTTFDGLVEAVGTALGSFSAVHCRNFLRHASYATN